MIHIEQAQHFKQLKPELAKLDDVVLVGLVLLKNSTYDRGHAEQGQQAHGKAHRTHEFVDTL